MDRLAWPLGTLLVLHVALAGALSAQSLGEVAARETERREHLQANKVYTNDDLKRFRPNLVEEGGLQTDVVRT
jgi:hypothetical protein